MGEVWSIKDEYGNEAELTRDKDKYGFCVEGYLASTSPSVWLDREQLKELRDAIDDELVNS